MARSSYCTIAITTALASLIAEATFSSESPVGLDSNRGTPVCYMQTGEGKTVDLSHLCGVTKNNHPTAITQIGKLLETKECPACSLRGANLSAANLAGANLNEADLSGANLSRANLLGANLLGTNLSNANLRGAIMPDGNIHP
jgi:hypothetical protein